MIAGSPGLEEGALQAGRRIANAFGLVLLLVVLTYVLASLTSFRGWSAVALAVVGSTTSCVAFTTAGASPRAVRAGVAIGGLSIALATIGAAGGGRTLAGVSALIQVLLLATAATMVLGAVVTESKVGFRTILGAISVFVMLSLLFAFLYVAIDRLQSGAFFAGDPKLGTGDYVFFSLTTLTTTGYGNLVPAAQPGKMIAGLEMLTGQIFVVTLIAGLVSMWRPGQWARARRAEKE
jgi:Ion channel